MSRQRVVRFGTATPLSGILTEPASGRLREQVGVIFLNSGILHHVGVNRLHVQMGRRMAELGFASLRFDFSGIGDSESRRDDLPFEQSAPLETQEAIDYMTKSQGVRGVVLLGLCSGADAAHLTGLIDERVVGLGLLDPWAYKTPMYFVHHYARRMVEPKMYSRWVRVRWRRLRNRLRGIAERGVQDPDVYEVPQYLREFPPREKVAGELSEFVRRGVQLFFMFSGGLDEYNHLGQYAAAFSDVDFRGLLREAHVRDATHVFSRLDHQALVVGELSGWVASRFGAPEGASTGSPAEAGSRTA